MPSPGIGLGQVAFVALWLVGGLALMRVGRELVTPLLPAGSPLAAPLGLPLALVGLWLPSFWLGHVLPLTVAGAIGLVIVVVLALVARSRRTGDSYAEDTGRDSGDADPSTLGSLFPGDFRIAAVVFAGAFLFMVLLRLVDPAAHPTGGEKFLDFGLLNSLLRTSTLPPEDMWFAGEPVSYYYGGHLLVSQITRLTGTPPEIAYNLALAGSYATLLTTAYGLAAGIAARVEAPHRLAGGLAVFFVGFASNLLPPLNLLAALLPEDLVASVAGALGYGLHGLAAGLEHFSYWTASRVIDGTINEFPLFAWLNGDMHAHMLQTSFTLLAAGLLAAYAWLPPGRVWRRRLVVGLLPALAGMAAVVNTWSFPTVAGLTLLGVYLAGPAPQSVLPRSIGARLTFDALVPNEAARLVTALALAGFVGLGGLAWSAPFWLQSATSRPLGIFPARSPVAGLLIVHGVFLLLFGIYLLRMAGAGASDARRGAALGALVFLFGGAAGMLGPALLLFLIIIGFFVLRTDCLAERMRGSDGSGRRPATDDRVTDDRVTTDGGPVAGATRPPRLPRPSFETVLIVAGLGLVLLVEFAHVDEGGAAPRFNTVFKVYMQVWILFGSAAGVVLARLVADHHPDLPLSTPRWRRRFRVLAAVLVVLTSIYGAFALVSHVEGTQLDETDALTLDATAFVDEAHPEEAAAIDWLDSREGQPTIVTAAPGGYYWTPSEGRGASAPASLTGVPTVLGWYHEAQYRGDEHYQPRLEAVRIIYSGDVAAQTAALRRYDVAFVYLGPAERAKYDPVTIDDHPALTVAAQFEQVTIYRVDQGALTGE